MESIEYLKQAFLRRCLKQKRLKLMHSHGLKLPKRIIWHCTGIVQLSLRQELNLGKRFRNFLRLQPHASYQKMLLTLQQILVQKGFALAQVDKIKIENEHCYIYCNPGPKYYIRSINFITQEAKIPGQIYGPTCAVARQFKGRSVTTERLLALERQIQVKWQAHGYWKSKVRAMVKPLMVDSPLLNKRLGLTVEVVISQGLPLRFGAVNFVSDNSQLVLPNCIYSCLEFQQGELWDAACLQATCKKIQGLGFFQEVHAQPGAPDSNGLVPITFALQNLDSGSASIMLGGTISNLWSRDGVGPDSGLLARSEGLQVQGRWHTRNLLLPVDQLLANGNVCLNKQTVSSTYRCLLSNLDACCFNLQGFLRHYPEREIRDPSWWNTGVLMQVAQQKFFGCQTGICFGGHFFNCTLPITPSDLQSPLKLSNKTWRQCFVIQPLFLYNRLSGNWFTRQGVCSNLSCKFLLPVSNDLPSAISGNADVAVFVPLLFSTTLMLRARAGGNIFWTYSAGENYWAHPNRLFNRVTIKSQWDGGLMPSNLFLGGQEVDEGSWQEQDLADIYRQGSYQWCSLHWQWRWNLQNRFGLAIFYTFSLDNQLLSSNASSTVEGYTYRANDHLSIQSLCGIGLRYQSPLGMVLCDIGWNRLHRHPIWRLTLSEGF